MKKIIYVILILTGIVSIASNFMVDTSKLDHKKVSASGTACKWISDNGYGVGPVYYDETVTVQSNLFPQFLWYSSSSQDNFYTAYDKFVSGLKLLDCNQAVNAGKTFNAGIVYADSKGNSLSKSIIINSTLTATLKSNLQSYFTDGFKETLFDNTAKTNTSPCNDNNDSVVISQDGKVTVNYPQTISLAYMNGNNSVEKSLISCEKELSLEIDATNLFASNIAFPIDLTTLYDDRGMSTYNTADTKSFNNKTIIEQPTQYTCVCAEY